MRARVAHARNVNLAVFAGVELGTGASVVVERRRVCAVGRVLALVFARVAESVDFAIFAGIG